MYINSTCKMVKSVSKPPSKKNTNEIWSLDEKIPLHNQCDILQIVITKILRWYKEGNCSFPSPIQVHCEVTYNN